MVKILKGAIGIALLVLSTCTSNQEPMADPVTWYAVNNSGNTMTIVLYDKLCNSRSNVRLSARRETSVTTCGDGNRRSDVRYRVSGYATRSGGWTHTSIRGENQRLVIN